MSRTDLNDGVLAERIRAACDAQSSAVAVADQPFDPGAGSSTGLPAAPSPSPHRRRILGVAAAVAVLAGIAAAIVVVRPGDGPEQLRTGTTTTVAAPVAGPGPTWLAPETPPFGLALESVSYRAVPPMDAPAAQLFVPASGAGRVLVQIEPGDGGSGGVPGPQVQGHETTTAASTDGRSQTITWADGAAITARYRDMEEAEAVALLDQLTWRSPDHLEGFDAPEDGSAVLVVGAPAGQVTHDAELTYRTGDRFVALATKVGEGPTFEQVEARYLAADLAPLDGAWSAYEPEDGELVVAWADQTAWLAADESVSEEQLRTIIPTLQLRTADQMRELERTTPGGDVATDPPVTSSTAPTTTVPGEASRWTSEEPLSVPLERYDGSGVTTLTELADGNQMVVLVWTSSCVPCIRAIEGFEAVAQERTDVVFVVVAVQDSTTSVEAIREHTDLTLPILLDADGALTAGWGVTAIPYAVAVGADGRIASAATGDLDGTLQVHGFVTSAFGS